MNIFNAEIISNFFEGYYFPFLLVVLLSAFFCTWYIIPKIIWVTNEKKLTKPVIDRSAHTNPVPSFGGVAFFISLILIFSMLQALQMSFSVYHLIAAMTILFMVGLKDDLVISSAKVKFVGQFIAVSFLVFSPELQIIGLHGFLGIEKIPYWLGCGLAAFLLLACINAYNLIDGIDGLASIVGIIIGSIYAGVFFVAKEPFYVLIAIALVGVLVAFLKFNISKGKNKIFMGDSGSLIMGLLIGFLTLKILNLDATALPIELFNPDNRFLFVLAVLFIPFFDTSRTMLIRIINHKSPFAADKNHTHHVLLGAGCNHIQASLFLGLLNLGVISCFLGIAAFLPSQGVTLIMLSVYASLCGIFYFIKRGFKFQFRIGKLIHSLR